MNYKKGDWYALCDVCSRRFFASELTKRWDNLMVCKEDYETRHPQDFVRSVGPDPKPLPFTRPDNDGIEPTLAINCAGHYEIPIPYRIDVDMIIYKGRTQLPPHISDVIIENDAEVVVHCNWIIEQLT